MRSDGLIQTISRPIMLSFSIPNLSILAYPVLTRNYSHRLCPISAPMLIPELGAHPIRIGQTFLKWSKSRIVLFSPAYCWPVLCASMLFNLRLSMQAARLLPPVHTTLVAPSNRSDRLRRWRKGRKIPETLLETASRVEGEDQSSGDRHVECVLPDRAAAEPGAARPEGQRPNSKQSGKEG